MIIAETDMQPEWLNWLFRAVAGVLLGMMIIIVAKSLRRDADVPSAARSGLPLLPFALALLCMSFRNPVTRLLGPVLLLVWVVAAIAYWRRTRLHSRLGATEKHRTE